MTLETSKESPPTSGIMTNPAARQMVREITWRFAYLRRVVMTEMSRALAPLGVTVPQFNVLFRLATADGPLAQQELTLDAGLDAAGVSRLVARMAKDKQVTIKVDARDRRRRLVRLTPKGRALEESLSPLVEAAVRDTMTGVTDEEALMVVQILERVVDNTVAREQERKRRNRRRAAADARGNTAPRARRTAGPPPA